MMYIVFAYFIYSIVLGRISDLNCVRCVKTFIYSEYVFVRKKNWSRYTPPSMLGYNVRKCKKFNPNNILRYMYIYLYIFRYIYVELTSPFRI